MTRQIYDPVCFIDRRLKIDHGFHAIYSTIHPPLSQSRLSNTSIIQTPKVNVPLEYFSIGVHY